jgi:KAP family P-loop domain
VTGWDWSAPLLTGPVQSGPIAAVATARLNDGRTLIISGGDDGVVRRWDAATGELVGEPLTGHPGWVRSVASARLDDGRTLIISGDSEGVLRRWNAATGEPVGEPLTGHPGPVRAMTSARLDDGRTLIISGSDWSVILWPLRANGQIAGEPMLAPRVRALSVVDDDTSGDELNRGVLAAHLEGLLVQLTTKQRAGTAVVHIDGKWGAGKSTLVNLLVGRLGSPHRSADGPTRQGLTDPVVIQYDAWRESTVAPEWWSLARSINMAVRSQRALATRVAMTVTGVVTRTARSRPVLVAGAVLLTMLVAWVSGAWKGDIGTIGKVLTTAATLATLGLVLGQVLFWASPAFGRLHQRADDNPLGEVAATVASLRRWSPRGSGGHRAADTLFALIVSATVTSYLIAVLRDPAIRSGPLAELRWAGAHAIGLGAAAITTLLVVGCWQRAPAWHPALEPAPQQQPTSPRSQTARRLVKVVLLTVTVVGAYVASSPRLVIRWLSPLRTFSPELAIRGLSPLRTIQRYPGWWAVGAVLGSVALYALWLTVRRRQPRRPVLLVIDDLDRCSAERVVKLMETVHTLLREPAEVRLLRSVRQPAPLIVLVLADGRWVRTAFETRYESFRTLGSPVHGLGADFLQKIFDHTVLVPALAANQVQTYVDHLTGISPWVRAGHTVASQDTNLIPTQALPPPRQSVADTNGQAQSHGEVGKPPPITAAVTAPEPVPASPEAAPVASATRRAERLIADAAPGEVHNQWVRAALDDTTRKERERLAEAIAAKAATTEALAVFSEDLLTRYAPLMPANPRLVKRVANTFGMLLALGLHLGHHENEDIIARAAILFVRFPTLVDDLLFTPDPPVLNPPADANPTDPASPWLRRDVQQILRRNGNLVDITQIARCYGRYYAPDPQLDTIKSAPKKIQ